MEPLKANGFNGQLSFDGATVIITREGFRARSMHGRSEKTLPLKSIGAVQFKPATSLISGWIQFSVAGEVSQKRIGVGRSHDASTDENAVIFQKKQMAEFEAIRDAVRAAQTAGDSPAPAAPNITEQLAKLAQLHDAGVLTDDEFAAKKTQLLERL